MALLYSIASKLAQFSSCMIGLMYDRWIRNSPQFIVSDLYLLYTVVSGGFNKYTPYSNEFHIIFPSSTIENSYRDLFWKNHLIEHEGKTLDPTSREVNHVMLVLVKIIQALSDGLRLQYDCKVYAKNYVQVDERRDKEIVVSSRFGKRRGCFDRERKFWGMNCNIEHLDGLNWEVVVVESEANNAYYCGNGKIALDTSMLNSFESEEELAFVLAHEVGHGVAMHTLWEPINIVWPFTLIPWSSVFWGPTMFLRLYDLFLYCSRRMEHEADYIAEMLMASAGYDPRLAPSFFKAREYYDDYYLASTHPLYGQRVQHLKRRGTMDRALKIYEQVQAGREVPRIV